MESLLKLLSTWLPDVVHICADKQMAHTSTSMIRGTDGDYPSFRSVEFSPPLVKLFCQFLDWGHFLWTQLNKRSSKAHDKVVGDSSTRNSRCICFFMLLLWGRRAPTVPSCTQRWRFSWCKNHGNSKIILEVGSALMPVEFNKDPLGVSSLSDTDRSCLPHGEQLVAFYKHRKGCRTWNK